MARITVEDCLDHLPNRFSLVLVSAERTKQLLRGAQPRVDNLEENKEVVLSLREIAAGNFEVDTSGIKAHDDWLPLHKIQPSTDDVVTDEEELPPEA